MKTIPYCIIGAAAFLVLAYKLRDLRKDPDNVVLRSLCLTIGLQGLAVLLAVPVIERFLERVTGVVALWATVPVAIACVSLQVTVLLWTYPTAQARPRVRRRLLVNGAAIALMTLLALLAPMDASALTRAGSVENVDRLFHGSPRTAESMLLYLAVYGYSVYDAGWRTLRHRRLVDRRWLRRGLGIVAMAALFNLGYAVTRAVHVVALRYFDVYLEPVYRVGPLFPLVGMLGLFFGWTMPAWGPRLDRIRAYRRLRPLWLALTRATPEVVFDAPGLGRIRWWHTSDLDFRLYRRIVEIRDSRLALRPYLDEDVAVAARERARRAGLEGETLRAAVEAATLAAAIRAKADGEPAVRQATDDGSSDFDLAEELIWFGLVAKAFTGSTEVTAAADTHMRSADPAA